jgi:hypothetical protein
LPGDYTFKVFLDRGELEVEGIFDAWHVVFRFRRAALIAADIQPGPDAEPLTLKAWRAIHTEATRLRDTELPASLDEVARRGEQLLHAHGDPGPFEEHRAAVHGLANDVRSRPTGGRRRRDPAEFARWAALYVDACTRSAHPRELLARETSYSTEHVRDTIAYARHLGLLTKPRPGRAGGQLTPKAKELLKES